MRILPVLLAAGGLLATAGAQEPPPKPRTPTGDYVGHSLRYWLDRTSYYRLPNPLNLHPNDGIDERLKAIEALGHYGSNGVPKLTLIVAEPKRTVAEQWGAVDVLKEIGLGARPAGPILLAFATNAFVKGPAVSSTGTGKAVDALAAIGATDTAPQLVTLFLKVIDNPVQWDADDREPLLYRMIAALDKLAPPKDARALIPALQAIAELPAVPPANPNSDLHDHLRVAARTYLKKLQAAP